MAELKTKANAGSVAAFLSGIEDEDRRRDCRRIAKLMEAATKAKPQMWGSSIVGFGSHHYRYASGREADWFLVGFSPRKRDLTLYLMAGFSGQHALMKKLGKVKTGKACLYINRLADIDEAVLAKLIKESVADLRKSRS